MRSLGVARPQVVGDAGTPVEIEGTTGEWRVDPEATADGFEGRTALLSPFDRLIHDRVRALELFDFEYTLEMYKPKDKRRWGYFALPVLHNDRLIGKVDATADRKSSRLLVHADPPRRPLHPGHDQGGRRRAACAGAVARPRRRARGLIAAGRSYAPVVVVRRILTLGSSLFGAVMLGVGTLFQPKVRPDDHWSQTPKVTVVIDADQDATSPRRLRTARARRPRAAPAQPRPL